jgi:REP element-mobilizing transposase RayT
MSRKANIDAPGALHHVTCRGMEKRKIFADVADRDGLFQRVAAVVKETRTSFCDWALTPNPLHLLLRTGAPIDVHGIKSWLSSFPLLK